MTEVKTYGYAVIQMSDCEPYGWLFDMKAMK